MRTRDTFDALTALAALLADAVAVFAGFTLAAWIRFRSGWIPLPHEGGPPMALYGYGAAVATPLFLFIFHNMGLYRRPQVGAFVDRVPRLVRAVAWSIFLSVALAFVIRTEPPFSRVTVLLSLLTIMFFLLIERYALYCLERRLIPRHKPVTRAVVIGTDAMADRLREGLEREQHLRTRVIGFLRMSRQRGHTDPAEEAVPPGEILGSLDDLSPLVEQHAVDMVFLSDTSIRREELVSIMLECERRLVGFYLVPDIFRVLTSSVQVHTIDGIPVIGPDKWPLDHFWNRMRKRAEDLVGATLGLLISAPFLLLAIWLIRRESPGPALYRQTRCGERGHPFTLYKLRTMRLDAEADTGPVWTSPDDQRRTRVGAVLRRFNLDELPQFWNVLRGDMSLVGPRPERPHFVEQFKEDISRYMWRHRSKPGMTGWAQVNGLRGQTSLKDRIKYDLYYLENWSFSLDFKIMIRTLMTRENAY